VALLLALNGSLANAGKPEKEPPPPGTIYFGEYVQSDDIHLYYKMKGDGSEKTLISAPFINAPSSALHAGERWFLKFMEVAGAPYPNGEPRKELFVASETGVLAQLTDDSSLEPNIVEGSDDACPHWATHMGIVDGKISYLAKRWLGGVVVEYGLYEAYIDPEGLPNHPTLEPFLTAVDWFLQKPEEWHGGILKGDYDWSPDGLEIVYANFGWNGSKNTWLGLWRADAYTGFEYQLTTDGWNPRWSPDGIKIAFHGPSSSGESGVDIEKVNADGTSRTTIIPDPPNSGWNITIGGPHWSPTGEHIIFQHRKYKFVGGIIRSVFNIHRATAEGGDEIDLTKDIDGIAAQAGWCAD
jgi:hypothetical protein